MNIKEMKDRRDDLWARLKEINEELARHPLRAEEAQIRGEIKGLQESLYREEMTPVFYDLKKKLSEGSIPEEKVEAFQKKFDLLKDKLGLE